MEAAVPYEHRRCYYPGVADQGVGQDAASAGCATAADVGWEEHTSPVAFDCPGVRTSPEGVDCLVVLSCIPVDHHFPGHLAGACLAAVRCRVRPADVR